MEDEDEAVKIALAKSVLFTIQEEEDCRIVQTISILFHFIYFFFNFIIFYFYYFYYYFFNFYNLFIFIFLLLLFFFCFYYFLFFGSSQFSARSSQLAVFSSLTPHIPEIFTEVTLKDSFELLDGI